MSGCSIRPFHLIPESNIFDGNYGIHFSELVFVYPKPVLTHSKHGNCPAIGGGSNGFSILFLDL